MGIRKYHNKYRVAVSINGKDTQTYLDTKEQAEEYLLNMKALSRAKAHVWAVKSKKRHNAKHQDLPVGWYEHVDVKHLPSGNIGAYNVISCSFLASGKRTVCRISYGKKRTRSQAIVELTKKIINKLKASKDET